MPVSKVITLGLLGIPVTALSFIPSKSAPATAMVEVIKIYATPLHSTTVESALPVNVISGDELKLKQASTLGETLKNEVGVHSSFYGSVASSPIIRGLDGPRVLITQNGLDAGDASRIGADHTVSTETSTATQIEVLRGPATLFYGSGAIGGVVNVVDNRIPTSSDSLAEWLLQYNNVSDEKQGSFSLQQGMQIAGENFAVHLDGFWRDAGDYRLPADFNPHANEETQEQHNENADYLANSASKSKGFTLGTSYLFEQGFVGFSYGTMMRDYSIPGNAHNDEAEHSENNGFEEGTQAEMNQDRLQLLSEINFTDGFIKQLATKFAYTDYQHQEIEDGQIGTSFFNQSIEIKMDLYHQDYMNWQGAWTLHYKSSDFKAVGEEAFVPPSITRNLAIAWLEEKHFGQVLLQLGMRFDYVEIDAEDSFFGFHAHHSVHDQTPEQELFNRQKFIPISSSTGLVWDYQQGYNIGLSAAFSQRAPSAAELISFGPHLGANTFEVGAVFDLSLEQEQKNGEIHVELAPQTPELETAYSIDLTWRKFEGNFGFVISTFYNNIKGYYYQQNTGLFFVAEEIVAEGNEDALPVFVYQQDDVDMFGLEAEFVYQIASPLKVSVFGDFIHATLSNGDYLPRTPPMRVGALLNYQGDSYDSEVSINHYFEQNNIASLETTTPAYSLIDFNYNYYLGNLGVDVLGSDVVFYVKGQNLTDEIALVHSSFLKEVAPLPGRNFSVGLRGSF